MKLLPFLVLFFAAIAAGDNSTFSAILNGMEVFKLQNNDNNLAGPNPDFPPQTDYEPRKIVSGVACGATIIALTIPLLVLYRKKRGKDADTSDQMLEQMLERNETSLQIGASQQSEHGSSGSLPLSLFEISNNAVISPSPKLNMPPISSTNEKGSHASSLLSNLYRHFSFAEIESATNKFDETRLLGVGRFRKVYRGEFVDGTKVAIKRGKQMRGQGVHEFQTEIEMLSKLNHGNLVFPIGYCDENREMILVYDYMAHGTLHEHLYKTQKPRCRGSSGSRSASTSREDCTTFTPERCLPSFTAT